MIKLGRKIPEHMDNPFDSLILSYIDPISDILRNCSPHIIPNMITTVGLFVGIASIYCLEKEYYVYAFGLYLLCYFFDCLDGHYARKYNMVTRFGDYYDHFRDLFVNVSVGCLIWKKLETKELRDVYIISIIIFGLGVLSHLGCQEQNSQLAENNDCLSLLKPLIKHKEYIYYTRYSGNGTFIIFLSIFILFLVIIQKTKKI